MIVPASLYGRMIELEDVYSQKLASYRPKSLLTLSSQHVCFVCVIRALAL